MSGSQSEDAKTSAKLKLAVGAIGIVFGDIGTSPLYAFRETFVGPHKLTIDDAHILGVVSLIFWSMTLIVSIQYVTILMRADNRGEGGTLSLVALMSRYLGGSKYAFLTVLFGVFATSLFYGDSMITPAISVLSAVEGLTVVNSHMDNLVIPIALVLLIGLFLLQKRGSAKVGALFAPIMIAYFCTLAVLGLIFIVQSPGVLIALNPYYALNFFFLDKWVAFLALGSVVLAVTGSEALYSDMGHFGRGPMRLSWFGFVMPCLLLNYFGQAAMILGMGDAAAAEAIQNPFFHMAPDALRLPLVLLATSAAFIASQAVITGAFSVTHQAIQLGFIPRLSIRHTSDEHHGQIYIPLINWALMIAVIVLVLTFRNSSNLASAYGIAVTGAMLIDTALMGVLLLAVFRWKWWQATPVILLFFIVDGAYFASNATKVPDGGWFPLMIAFFAFTLLTTWAKGRKLMRAQGWPRTRAWRGDARGLVGRTAMAVEVGVERLDHHPLRRRDGAQLRQFVGVQRSCIGVGEQARLVDDQLGHRHEVVDGRRVAVFGQPCLRHGVAQLGPFAEREQRLVATGARTGRCDGNTCSAVR